MNGSEKNFDPIIERIVVGGVILVALFILSSPASASWLRASTNGSWYVAPGGSDGNSCQIPTEPCATINAAIGMASPGDTVKVAVGTYTPSWNPPVGEVVLVNVDINLSGGWDSLFTGQSGFSTIDGGVTRRGITVNSGVNAQVERFVIQNGYNGGVRNSGTLTMTNVTVSNNQYQGIANIGTLTIIGSVIIDNYWDGIGNSGTLYVQNSSVIDNRSCTGCGGGISSYGAAFIQNSTISNNAGWGIKSTSSNPVALLNSTVDHNSRFGVDIYAGTVYAINSTISTNTDGGIVVENNGSISLYNSTVSYNGNQDPTSYGGGIRVGWGTVHLANTILANNIADAGPDCFADANEMVSEGYNLIGSTLWCNYTPTTGDLTVINPQLAPFLQDNGGPTRTHALLRISPAIDRGDPAGCKDHLGNPLATDQRGMPRMNRCDIGAYEFQLEENRSAIYFPCLFSSCVKLFFDDFSDPGSGWYVGEDADARLEYLGDEYRILAKKAGMFIGARSGFKTSDSIVVVDVRNVTGVEGAYGIIFGLADDWTHFYTYEISPYGGYAVLRYDGSASSWTTLVTGTSASIHSGTATNQLKVKRNGAEISIYANGQLLNTINDGIYTGIGQVGAVVKSFSQPDVDIRFDNFTVYPLNCQVSMAFRAQDGITGTDGSSFHLIQLPSYLDDQSDP